jgi:hypothetical protein
MRSPRLSVSQSIYDLLSILRALLAVTRKGKIWLTAPMSSVPTSPARIPASQIAYNLAGIAVIVLLGAVGLAYAIDQAGKMPAHVQPTIADENTVTQTIGGQELAIPLAWFRYGEQQKPGFASQADLAFVLALPHGPERVEVTLLPRNRARSSSTLLDTVYLHQFGEGGAEGVPGLVGKPLNADDGYAGETVWYDPLSPSPFVAKCSVSLEPDRPTACLRTIHLPTGLAAVVRFDATALGAWRAFDDELARWLEPIGAL